MIILFNIITNFVCIFKMTISYNLFYYICFIEKVRIFFNSFFSWFNNFIIDFKFLPLLIALFEYIDGIELFVWLFMIASSNLWIDRKKLLSFGVVLFICPWLDPIAFVVDSIFNGTMNANAMLSHRSLSPTLSWL